MDWDGGKPLVVDEAGGADDDTFPGEVGAGEVGERDDEAGYGRSAQDELSGLYRGKLIYWKLWYRDSPSCPYNVLASSPLAV